MPDNPTKEYALFNLLPDGQTIEDIPPGKRWQYIYPFRVNVSRKLIELRMAEVNRDRLRLIHKMDYHGDIKTMCVMRERTVTYSDWRDSTEE